MDDSTAFEALRRINLNLFYALDAILNTRTLTEAADKIHLSQPAISRALAKLRSDFRDELILYRGDQRQLTPLAETIRPQVRGLLRQAQHTVDLSRGFDPVTDRRAIRFCAPDAIEIVVVGELMHNLWHEAPHVRMLAQPFTGKPVAQMFEDGLDIAIIPRALADPDFSTLTLYKDRLACVVSADHPLVEVDVVDADDYLAARHVALFESIDVLYPAPGPLRDLMVKRSIAMRTAVQATLPELIVGTDLILTTSTRYAQRTACTLPIKVLALRELMKTCRFLSASAAAIAIPFAMCAPAVAAQRAISVPALPLADALEEIGKQAGRKIRFDPAAVSGKTSAPVRDATSARDAVITATDGQGLTVSTDPYGQIVVAHDNGDIVVTARLDEAETNIVVRATSTSDRSGQSLRQQPRNAVVVTAKLLADQQAQSISDAVRATSGVTVRPAGSQAAASYSIRGFASDALVNGLSTAAGGAASTAGNQSIANVERIEVRKGPDAILAGANNLGGTINIVSKRPTAEPLLNLLAETGSWGQRRFVIDGSNALTADKTLSARVIAEIGGADENYGGYLGNGAKLLAPSLRYKNNTSDFIVGLAANENQIGAIPYDIYDTPATIYRFSQRRVGPTDQGIRSTSTNYYYDSTQKVGDWLTLVSRGSYATSDLNFRNYNLLGFASATTLLINVGSAQQESTAKSIDSYARAKFSTFGIRHTLSAGYAYTATQTIARASSQALNAITPSPVYTAPIPEVTIPGIAIDQTRVKGREDGYYAQDLVEFWRLHLIAQVRRSSYWSQVYFYPGILGPAASLNAPTASTQWLPSFGAVLDITNSVSLFGNYVKGFSPNFRTDFQGNLLPNKEAENIEAGVKLDLFRRRATVVASVFQLTQSNSLFADLAHPGFFIAGPGQRGKGFDIDLRGEIVPGLSLIGSLNYTDFNVLTKDPDDRLNYVRGQPEWRYSLYANYQRKVGNDVTIGAAAGINGASSFRARVTRTGRTPNFTYFQYFVPESRQVDVNGFITIGQATLNIGIRNLFDRYNYWITYNETYLPVQEPRNVRATLTYRFF